MTLFRSVSFYLSLIGLIAAVLFVIKIMQPPPPSKPLNPPAANPYHYSVAASGIIEAVDRNVLIGTAVSGLVEKIFVNVGDSVKKEEPLFEIDGRDLKAKLLVQKATLEISKATLEKLKDQLKRLELVKDPHAVSVEEVKTKKNDVIIAEREIDASSAAVKETEELIKRLTVLAPKHGVILQNNIRVGEYVQTNASQAPMVLGNLERLQIRADIDEVNAVDYMVGAKAVAFPKNNTRFSIPLTFSYIEPYVVPKKSLTSNSSERVDTRVLQVIYTFEKPKNFPIYVGQQVDVFIEGNRKELQQKDEKP